MPGRKGTLIIAALFAAAAAGSVFAKSTLDRRIREGVRRAAAYTAPLRGVSPQAFAFGFNSPAADALFLAAVLEFDGGAGRPDQVAALVDAATDLNPGFGRAYLMGAELLTSTSSPDAIESGRRLLEKGVAALDRLAGAASAAGSDMRWLFHALLAGIHDVKLQSIRRAAGDGAGAARARRMAGREYFLAAVSPDAPPLLASAAAGYRTTLSGADAAEDILAASVAVWERLRERATAGAVASKAKKRSEEIREHLGAIARTRAMEAAFAGDSAAGMAGLPPDPLSGAAGPEAWLPLPGGGARSRALARLNTASHLETLAVACLDYVRAYGRPPPDPEALTRSGCIDHLPEPPLRALGQEYVYDPRSGTFASQLPNGADKRRQ